MNFRTKFLLAAVIFAVIGFSVFQIINNMRFRVVKTAPNTTGAVATDFKAFEIEFNRELKANVDYSQRLTDTGDLVTEIATSGKTMVIKIKTLQNQTPYAFTISRIEATDGSMVNEVKFDFVARYIAFDRLPKDQQALIEKQNTVSVAENPILQHLPHGDLHYRLDGVFKESAEESGELGNLVLEAQLYLSNADVKINREEAIARYKQEVIDYIKSIGYDPSQFTINYTAVDPT